MKAYLVFSNQGGYDNSYGDGYCNSVEKVFSSKEAAERFVNDDCISDMIRKIEVADCPGVTWYYYMDCPAKRIEEHVLED